MTALLLLAAASAMTANDGGARFDAQLIPEAARQAQQMLPWTRDATLVRGCLVADSPLTVKLEYERDGGLRYVQAVLPWRVASWMVQDEGGEPCDVATRTFPEGGNG